MEYCIFSEIQAILKALLKPMATSALVQEWRDALQELVTTKPVKFKCVSERSGVDGNERVDRFAELSSSTLP